MANKRLKLEDCHEGLVLRSIACSKLPEGKYAILEDGEGLYIKLSKRERVFLRDLPVDEVSYIVGVIKS